MTTLTLRSGKGSALTFAELDDNFSNLNTDLGTTTTALGDYLPLAGGSLTGDITTTGEINIADGNWVAWGGGTGRPLIMGNKADGNMKFYIAGAIRAQLEETSMTFNVADVQINSKLSHNGDANTFLNFGTDTLGITTGGTERIAVSSTGLDVTGDITTTSDINVTDGRWISWGTGGAITSRPLIMGNNTDDNLKFYIAGGLRAQLEADLFTLNVSDVQIASKLSHVGDADTFLNFGTDTLGITTGATERIAVSNTGLDVTGAITVSGNVDGRDVCSRRSQTRHHIKQC